MPISFYWEKTPDYDISTKNSYHRHGVLNEVVIPCYTCLFSSSLGHRLAIRIYCLISVIDSIPYYLNIRK